MAAIAAPVAAPHVVDHRFRLLMLDLEPRDQGVLRRYGHGSPLAVDVEADREFERHALNPSKAIFASRRIVEAWVKQDFQTVAIGQTSGIPIRRTSASTKSSRVRRDPSVEKPILWPLERREKF